MSNLAKLCLGCALAAALGMAEGTAAAAIIQEAEYNGSTYYLLSSDEWHESEDEALSLGGHLVTIDDLDEHNFVLDTFGPTAVSHSPASGKVNLWIGLSDLTLDGSYEWCDDSPIDYMNFFPEQPQRNHADEMFMGIRVRGTNSTIPVDRWIDIVSDTRLGDLNYGVVEVTSVPEPAAWMLAIAGGMYLAFATIRWHRKDRCGKFQLISLARLAHLRRSSFPPRSYSPPPALSHRRPVW